MAEGLKRKWSEAITAKMRREEKNELESHIKMYFNGFTTEREFAL